MDRQVKDAKGNERGRPIQLNTIPAGSLDHYWGDVASVVAIEEITNHLLNQRHPRLVTPDAYAKLAASEPRSTIAANKSHLTRLTSHL